jgi:uncharacterized protein (DUF1800 family)
MDSYDAHPRTGRRAAADPAAPPRRRRAVEEPAFEALVDPQDLFRPSQPPAPPQPSRRELREQEAGLALAERREERRPGTMARRTALTFAGSGAALVGVAVATHKAPGEPELDEATRNLVARPKTTPMPPPTASAPSGTTRTAKVEYQTTAAGKAPKPAAPTVKQPPTVLALDPAVHLARRATWGPTAASVRQIKKMGTAKWVEWQLRPSRIPDPLVAQYLRGFDTLGASPQQLRSWNDARSKQDYWYAHNQLESAAIVRAAWSERQLFEVVVDFFHSRLHVPAHIDKTRDFLNHYDAVVIRKHAFGKFRDMLWAMITHPAMIVYLDNHRNTKYGGNQNLGRELLELHTVGVDAGYKQADVAAAALLLTGLSVDDKTGGFVYRPDQHQTGAVRVFGGRYANASAGAGMATVKALIANLAKHPKTARYLALDLARRFVSDAPSKRLVDRLAAVYLKNDTAIVPVLRALFTSPEFTHSVGQKYRRPLENAVATMRVLGVRRGEEGQFQQSLGDLRWWLESTGQSPLGRSTPDGYPDFARPWLSSGGVLGRWNLDMSLVGGWRKGFSKPDVSKILAGATTYGAAVDKLYVALTFQKPSAATRRALLAFVGHAAGGTLSAQARANDYRLRVQLPAVILGGPHHQLR